jgi:hypothetical protein
MVCEIRYGDLPTEGLLRESQFILIEIIMKEDDLWNTSWLLAGYISHELYNPGQELMPMTLSLAHSRWNQVAVTGPKGVYTVRTMYIMKRCEIRGIRGRH